MRGMKITKKYTKTYEILPPAMKWQMSVGDFIAKRKQLGLKTQGYDRCFACGYVFENDFKPNLACVKIKGNMFFCDKCANEINATPTEKGGE